MKDEGNGMWCALLKSLQPYFSLCYCRHQPCYSPRTRPWCLACAARSCLPACLPVECGLKNHRPAAATACLPHASCRLYVWHTPGVHRHDEAMCAPLQGHTGMMRRRWWCWMAW